ncbi:MAG TPA: outer membrane beta-barrel protein [Acidobacteriota bacterium]|nr:outer membrane beta-barrel protein [Acidobacteriota bacterium]
MRKTAAALGLVLVLFTAAAPALAQSSIVSQIAGGKAATDKLYFGLKFGFACSQLRGLGYGDRLGGFDVGLFAMIRLADKLYLAPEITPFSRKGATEIPFVATGDPALDPYFADLKRSALILDYVDIPVRLLYRLGRFDLGAGPFVGSLSSASRRFVADAPGGELKHTQDVAAEFRDVNYGFVLEAAWTITKPRRGQGLVFHIRYQGGLADVFRDPAAAGSVRTSGLQIFLSFPFIR